MMMERKIIEERKRKLQKKKVESLSEIEDVESHEEHDLLKIYSPSPLVLGEYHTDVCLPR